MGKSPGTPYGAFLLLYLEPKSGGMQMADAFLGELGVHTRTNRVTRRLGCEAPAEHELDMGIGL